MEKKYKLSVVIPIYNVEKYLEETLKSVIEQTLGFENNIEMILVNDGSPDNSEEICLRYKEKYPENIVYIKQKNGGVSSARNAGIEQAQGKYVCFVDSDDYILANYCEKMLNEMNEHNADIVICNLLDNGVPEYKLISTLVLDISNKDNFIDVYKNYQFLSPVNKLFKKDLI